MKAIVNIDVPDITKAIHFYTSAMELEFNRLIDDDVAELTGTSFVIYLLKNPPGSKSLDKDQLLRSYSRHWTPIHIDFVVDDVEAAVRIAVDAGAKQESKCIEWRGSRCITLSDPFGHGFCFIEFNAETYS